MVGQSVEQCCGHLGIAEDAGPFAEAQVGRDDDTGSLIELAEQMEQQCSARRAERQVSKLVEDHEIGMNESIGYLSRFTLGLLLFKRIDQLNG
jgi:hypothetical protein